MIGGLSNSNSSPKPDRYLWLEERNGADANVWVKKQNDQTDRFLSTLPGREKLEHRFQELFTPLVGSITQQAGPYTFLQKQFGSEPTRLLVKTGSQSAEKELLKLDQNESLGWFSASPDGSLVACATYHEGKEDHRVRILDTRTGQVLPDQVSDGGWTPNMFSWTPDGDGFYYAGRTGEGTHFHQIGATDSPVVSRVRAGPYDSMAMDDHWLAIAAQNNLVLVDRGESGKVVNLGQGEGWNRAPVSFDQGKLWTLSREGADNGRLYCIDPKHPQPKHWLEVLPEDKDMPGYQGRVLREFALNGDKVCAHYLKDAHSQLIVANRDGSGVTEVPLPGVGSVSGLHAGQGGRMEFSYSSLHQPYTNYSYNPADGQLTLVNQRKLDGYHPENFDTQLQWATSQDGTRVPVFIVAKKGLPLDGKNPAVLYGYGGFQMAQSPAFTSTIVPFLESGGVYCLAGLRGGLEFGEDWHRDGMLDKKQNVFDDAAAAARHLIDSGLTSPEHLAVSGGSNGGLMVGALITQHPELFKAAIARVPLMDMMRYDQIDGPAYVAEYGSAQNPAQAEFLANYSPYQHVRSGVAYPTTLLTTGRNDARVSPAHARKMAALMQSSSTQPVLFREDVHGGHGVGLTLAQNVENQADEWGFLLHELT